MTEHSIKAEEDTGVDPASNMINSSCNVQAVTTSPMLGSGRKRKQDLQYPGNRAFTTTDSWSTPAASVDNNHPHPTTSFEYPSISSWSSNSNTMQQYKHSSLLHEDHHHHQQVNDTSLVVDEHPQGK